MLAACCSLFAVRCVLLVVVSDCCLLAFDV